MSALHPRISVSAISTYRWSLDEDLAFYADAGIRHVGISVAKLEQAGWDDGVRRVCDAGLRVGNLIGLGPFHLVDPTRWDRQRARLERSLTAASDLAAECVVFTTGPAGSLTWEEAADALEAALASTLADAGRRGVAFALEHTNSLRVDVGFVHTLRDAVALARRLGTDVCVELNACWAERGLAETIERGIERFRLVQVSDFAVGTLTTPDRLVPGDGDVPLVRILREILAAGYGGAFDLELIGPRIEEEGYASALRRATEWLSATLADLGA